MILELEKRIDAKITLKSLSLSFPTTLKIEELAIGDFLKSDFLISPNIWALFAGKVVINKFVMLNPQINIQRNRDGTFNLPKLIEQGKKTPPPIILGLVLRNGKVSLVDKNVDSGGFNLQVKDINVLVGRKSFGLPPYVLKFKASADIPTDKEVAAKIDSQGWLDVLKKNMQGYFSLENLDGVYFYPYYKNATSLKPQKANIGFKADLEAKDNNLIAKCHLEVKDIDFGPMEAPTQENIFGALTGVLGNLTTFTDKIIIDFVVKTRLDSPKFTPTEIKGKIINKPIDQIIQKVPQIIENIQDIGKQIKDMGKDLGEKFKGILEGAPLPAPQTPQEAPPTETAPGTAPAPAGN